MILTEKAKKDFEFWYWNDWFEDKERNYYKSEYEAFDNLKKTDKVFLNAIIIEWFDSVGIIINIGGVMINGVFDFSFDIQQNNTLNGIDTYGLKTRKEATTQAIIKANEIYNAILED